jgi:hypothetical protein
VVGNLRRVVTTDKEQDCRPVQECN